MDRFPEVPTGKEEDNVYGRNAVLSALGSAPQLCSRVMISERLKGMERDKMIDLCRGSGIPWQIVKPSLLDRLCPGGRHQGVAVKMMPVGVVDIGSLPTQVTNHGGHSLLILLDHIQDPQNLGAIARSAEVFGADAIVIPKRRSALPTSTVMKTSAGAIARVPVAGVVNVARALKDLKEMGYWAVGLHHGADEELGNRDLPGRTVLVVGGEGSGLSRLAAASCDFLLRIPMKGSTGSLNAASAAAIGMYEWRRIIDKAS